MRKGRESGCNSGSKREGLGNLNVTLATQGALIGNRLIAPRVKGLGAQGKRKRLLGMTA